MSEVINILILSAIMFAFILVVLLFIWALKPSRQSKKSKQEGKVRKEVKGDLKKIKDQINGE